jgi:hypothetical protein
LIDKFDRRKLRSLKHHEIWDAEITKCEDGRSEDRREVKRAEK